MKHALTLSVALTLAIAAPAYAETAAASNDPDVRLLRAVNSFGAPYLDGPMAAASNIGFLMLAPVALSYAAAPGYELPLLVAGTEMAGGLASMPIKYLVRRPRPYMTFSDIRTPDGPVPLDPYSFPSGHASTSFAAATFIADWNPAFALPAYGLAALISYSRLYNGVHYPSDVIVGAALGVGTAKLTRWGYDQWRGSTPKESNPPMLLNFSTRF